LRATPKTAILAN